MKNFSLRICLIVVLLTETVTIQGLYRTYQAGRRNYPTFRRVQGTRPARDAKKQGVRFVTTGGPEKEKSLIPFEQPLEVVPFERVSGITQQEERASLLGRIKSWWYGISQPSQALVVSEQRVNQMFNFVLSEMNKFRTVLWVNFDVENKLLVRDMKMFFNTLDSEYRDVLRGQKNGYTIAGPVLFLIHDYLMTAMQNCKLGDRLMLAYVFSTCDLLQKIRGLGVELAVNDKKIARDIVQTINQRLMANPTLLLYLEDLNLTLEPNRRLSDDEIAIVIKNSALLVPIDEVQSFNEILRAVKGISLGLTTDRLNALLKSIGLNKNESVLNLWERGQFLKRLYAGLEFKATESDQKEKYKKQAVRDQETIKLIIAALGITDVYAAALKQLTPSHYKQEQVLQEIFDNAYSADKKSLSIEAYALKVLKNKSKESEMFKRRNQTKEQAITVEE